MAKVRVKLGENEVEIDSRDFYVDNKTVGEVVEKVSQSIEGRARVVYEAPAAPDPLVGLDEAEAFEPEFSEPAPISAQAVYSKLQELVKQSFFDEPRTAPEAAERLRQCGWAAKLLDVSTALTRMTITREMARGSEKSSYLAKKQLLA